MDADKVLFELAVLHSPDHDGWRPGAPVEYMTCKGCDVNTGGGGCRRLWTQCPTMAVIRKYDGYHAFSERTWD